jgi:hypothetical protein
MSRLFALVLFALGFAASSWAQGTVLVPALPQYADGESYKKGTMQILDGEVLKIDQWIEKKGGRTFMRIDTYDADGRVDLRSFYDTGTLLGKSVSSGEEIIMLSSNCSAATIYPIVLYKRYDCTVETETNGRRSQVTKSIIYDQYLHDESGRPTQFCGLIEEDYADMEAVVELCHTLDGKWVTQINILKAEKKIRS